MLTYAVIAAVAMLLLAGGKSTTEITTALSEKVQAELKRLYVQNPQAYSAVNTLLMGGGGAGSPALMMQYALQLSSGYPAIAEALSIRFNQIVVKERGKSGTEWFLWSSGTRPDGWTPVEVLYGATTILSYMQFGENKAQRRLVGVLDVSKYANAAEMKKVVDSAKADFGPFV